MRNTSVKGWLVVALALVPVLGWAQTHELQTIKLNEPNKKRGLPLMEALSVRASVRDWSARELSLQDLSDLLWAADGINRPDSKKRELLAYLEREHAADRLDYDEGCKNW